MMRVLSTGIADTDASASPEEPKEASLAPQQTQRPRSGAAQNLAEALDLEPGEVFYIAFGAKPGESSLPKAGA